MKDLALITPHQRRHRARHPSWRRELTPGSVIIGQTATGEYIHISPESRRQGMQIVGLPDHGKSKAIENMIRQDILGLCGVPRSVIFIDPHGTSYNALLDWCVTHRVDRLRSIRLLDATSSDFVFFLNPLKGRPGVDPSVIADAVTNAILRGVWGGQDPTSMPQIRETLKICTYSLCEFGLTLLEAKELLAIIDDSGLRAYAAMRSRNATVRDFWRSIDQLKPAERDQKLGGARRRLNEFFLPRRTQQIFSEPEDVVDFRRAMDEGEVVFINLAHGNGILSEDQATLLGTLIISDIFLACHGRSEDAPPTYLYIDECHRFATEDMARFFTEARKFRVHPIVAHQIFSQLKEAGPFVEGAIMSAPNKIIFGGLAPDDADLAARHAFRGQFDVQRAKSRYDKPVVVGHETAWLLSGSVGVGTALAHGDNWSQGGGTADHKSTTRSTTETYSESETITESDTTVESSAFTEGDTYSQATSASDSHSRSSGQTASRGGSASGAMTRSRSEAQAYDIKGNPVGGATLATRRASTGGSASSWGRANARGSSDSYSRGSTNGSAHSTSMTTGTSEAHTAGFAQTTGYSVSEGLAQTIGSTESKNWSKGGSTTRTGSTQFTLGAGQTLRPVLKVMPTQSFSLDELLHEASVRIAELPRGEAIVKIGRLPAAHVATVRVRDARPLTAHVARVVARLAAEVPYLRPIAEAQANYVTWRQELFARIAQALRPALGVQRSLPPPLKDGNEGWG